MKNKVWAKIRELIYSMEGCNTRRLVEIAEEKDDYELLYEIENQIYDFYPEPQSTEIRELLIYG